MKSILAVIVLTLSVTASVAYGSETLSKKMLDQVTSAVFEVVVRKPADLVKYDPPDALDNLPFKQRMDNYIPQGTAFAISPKEFVSAAHVLEIDKETQLRGLAIRDSAGRVFPIRQVKKYSMRRDFVVFEVEGDTGAAALPVNSNPEMNTKTFAVGNALGEGVIVRDGLLTSMTPEELKGEWKWLRFSAAASPGNSGGPLLDSDGRVIGLILRRSQNENLNIALPIREILDAPPEADLFLERTFSVDNLRVKKDGTFEKHFPLPMEVESLRKVLWDETKKFKKRMFAAMMEENRETIFPKGKESRKLLGSALLDDFPHIVVRSLSGEWIMARPDKLSKVDVGVNGFVAYGDLENVRFAVIDLPDDITIKEVFTDSNSMMNLMLKGWPVTRKINGKEVRVLSVGGADTTSLHVDDWGRKWLVQTWPLPEDMKLLVLSLPVPGGFISMQRITSTSEAETCDQFELKIMSSFVNAQFSGKLKQWQEYLSMKELLPEPISRSTIVSDERGLKFSCSRMAFRFGKGVKSPDLTLLGLSFAFISDGKEMVWDVANVVVAENNEGVLLQRHEKPTSEMGEDSMAGWKKLTERKWPFDGTPIPQDQMTIALDVLPSGVASEELQKARVLYSIGYIKEGQRTKEELSGGLAAAKEAVTIMEDCGIGRKGM